MGRKSGDMNDNPLSTHNLNTPYRGLSLFARFTFPHRTYIHIGLHISSVLIHYSAGCISKHLCRRNKHLLHSRLQNARSHQMWQSISYFIRIILNIGVNEIFCFLLHTTTISINAINSSRQDHCCIYFSSVLSSPGRDQVSVKFLTKAVSLLIRVAYFSS